METASAHGHGKIVCYKYLKWVSPRNWFQKRVDMGRPEALASSTAIYAFNNCLINSRTMVLVHEFEFYHIPHKMATRLVQYPCQFCHFGLCDTLKASLGSGCSALSDPPQFFTFDHEVPCSILGFPSISRALPMVQFQQCIQDGCEHWFRGKPGS